MTTFNNTSDARFEAVMKTVLDGLIIIDHKGNIQSFNPAAEKIFGYEQHEVQGQNVKILMPDPYHSEHDGYLQNYLTTGEKKVIGSGREVEAQRKDGSTFPMELSVNEMQFNGQRMFVGTIRDITERKKAEERISQEVQRLNAVMKTVLDGVITINSSGEIQSFNPAAERIFGYKSADVIGKNVKILMPDPYHSEHDGYLQNYLSTGDKKVIGIGREVRAQRKNGKTFPMELGINEMSFNNERMFVGTIRDITERKDAEAAINESLDQLKRSNQELDDFAYIASHDLKEPIRGVTNNILFLQEDYEGKFDEAGDRRIKRLVYLCGRMEQLVDDLLYFSRLGRQDLAVQATNLNDLLQDIQLMHEDLLRETNTKIIIPQDLPTITCDLPRITEVFRNLINNAIKYNNKDEKTIEIGWELRNGQYIFSVKDNGIGIEPEFHNDIFRIFKRLNEEDDSKRGTGVGLTFVKKIIERHDGSIWLDSTFGEGTTFYFSLNTNLKVAA